MKIRNGFVSNSSSSSFVYIIDGEKYKEFIKSLDGYQKEIIKALAPSKETVLGKEAFVISGGSGNSSCFEYMSIKFDEDLDEDEWNEKYKYERYPSEAFEEISFPDGTYVKYVDV
jgi:hypothetical protein